MKKLKKEFEDKFCYQKFPFDNGDLRFSCASTNNKVWQWIGENFEPKKAIRHQTVVSFAEPNQQLFTIAEIKKLLDDYCGLIIAYVRDNLFENRPTSDTADTMPIRAKQNLAYLKVRNLIETAPKPKVKS